MTNAKDQGRKSQIVGLTPPPQEKPSIKDQVEALVPEEPENAETVPATRPELPPEVQQAAGMGTLDPEVARVMAEMQTTIDALNQRLTKAEQDSGGDDETEAGAGGYPWQYYQKPNIGPEAGWIVTAPGGGAKGGKRDAGSFAGYVARGHRPIMEYGVAPVPSDAPKPGQSFWPMIENGGAKEFPAAQVLAYKWHQEPPIAGITFSQYERVKGTELTFLCDECELELSFLPDDELAPRACFTHLRNAHDYPRGEAKQAMDAQGITNVAPYAIRQEAKALERDGRVKELAE